ncbi:MAG: pilus assembly protein, partial [Thiohalomonadales bacterium]
FIDGGKCTVNEWDDDGDCNPDTFYLANDGYELVSELTAAFASIKRRASSGGAASVISASSSGEGAIFQALFHTTMTNSTYDVKWTGDVHGLFIDSEGLIHQDDGDQVLEGPASDNIVDMCFDKGAQTVRVKLSSSKATRPTAPQSKTCSTSVFTNTLFDIDYLWSGGEWLRDLTNTQAMTQTASFPLSVGSKSRYMLTGIDADADGIIQPSEAKPFIASTFASNFGLLQATDATNAAEIVNFIRGKDQAGYRSRQIDTNKTWRLGDVVYSTPTPYGRPAENLHLIYYDNATVSTEYLAFKQQYNNRRQVIYAGSNDGVLHAFNGGWYDATLKKYENGPAGTAQIELGTEIWSYIPYNMLPHLKHISDPSYGQTTGNHIYGVDLQPRIFDAKIFTDDPDHPKGWGSVLVGGMRFGGGEITVGTTTLRSSFFILDITNPEKEPKLLLEFTDPNLGFTTSTPAPFVHNGVFYLMLGSGPSNTSTGIQTAASTQNGRLFLINLSNMSLDTDFGSSGILTLPDANSFVSDLTAIDYNLDYNASSIYFGTVSGSGIPWGGKLYRIQTQNEDGSKIAVSAWAATELLNPGAPIVAKPASSVDASGNRWIFAGTGRYFTRFDATDNSQQYMFGVKEPRNTSGDLTWATALTTNMVNVSDAEVESVTTALTGVKAETSNLSLPADPLFDDLDKAMQQFDSNYVNGWYRNLSLAGNRVIGEATLFGGTLNHTSYKPSAAICTVDGTAELHVNYFTTGTASGKAIIGEKTTKGVTYPFIETTLNIGSTPALSPSLHTGKGYETDKSTKAFIQTSDGKITEIEQENNEAVRSGESSWRIYN